MSTSIVDQLRASVAARKDSLKSLRSRIAELLEPIPVGVVLSDESGEVCKIVRVCTGASQWSNRTWEVTIKGRGAIEADGCGPRRLICEDLEDSYFDGHSIHYRKTEPTCLTECQVGYVVPTDELRWLPGSETRALALRLPAAIARYMERCEEERVANEATLSA